MEADEVDDKAQLLVVLHLVDIHSVSLGLQGVLCLSLNCLFLCEGVDSNLPVVGLPVNSAKFQDFPLHLNLLMWHHITFLNVEELNDPFLRFFLGIEVRHGQVVSLWVYVHLKFFRAFEVCGADLLPRRNLHKADSRVQALDFLVFICLAVDAGVDKKVSVGCPLPFRDALDSDRLLSSLFVCKQLH